MFLFAHCGVSDYMGKAGGKNLTVDQCSVQPTVQQLARWKASGRVVDDKAQAQVWVKSFSGRE